jgi:predicted SprT family Zn-dependent metalloprotease
MKTWTITHRPVTGPRVEDVTVANTRHSAACTWLVAQGIEVSLTGRTVEQQVVNTWLLADKDGDAGTITVAPSVLSEWVGSSVEGAVRKYLGAPAKAPAASAPAPAPLVATSAPAPSKPITVLLPEDLRDGLNASNLLQRTRDLLDHHSLGGITVGWDKAGSRLGAAHWVKVPVPHYIGITFSRRLSETASEEELFETMTHEVAHVLAGPGEGHSATWRRIHQGMGGDGKRTAKVDANRMAWKGTCPNGHEMGKSRLTNRARWSSCSKCSPTYDTRFLFTWTKNR